MDARIRTGHSEMEDVLQRFVPSHRPAGYLAESLEVIRGLVGTFLSPYSNVAGHKISGDAVHRIEIVAPYQSNYLGLTQKLAEEQQQISNLTKRLNQLGTQDLPETQAEIEQELLAHREALSSTHRDLILLKGTVLSRMRETLNTDTSISNTHRNLIRDIETLYDRVLTEFSAVNDQLSAVREARDIVFGSWTLRSPIEIVEPTQKYLEAKMDLAKHPWKRKGLLELVKEYLNIADVNPQAAYRALDSISRTLKNPMNDDLNSGDLKQLFLKMETFTTEGKDQHSKITRALATLKDLLKATAIDHPDEVRRMASLGIFLVVSTMTGGGLMSVLSGASAKFVFDSFLKNCIPVIDPRKPSTTLSKALYVAEGVLALTSLGMAGLSGHAMAEIAHNQVPNAARPAFVFAAAYFGLGLPSLASASAVAATSYSATTIGLVKQIIQVAMLLRHPRKLIALVGSCVRQYVVSMGDAARAGRWVEVSLRVTAVVLPILIVAALMASPFLPFIASTVGCTAFTAALVLAAVIAGLALFGVIHTNEKHQRQLMTENLKKWRSDYDSQFIDPSQRDTGVIKLFDEMTRKVRSGEKLDHKTLFRLMKTHMPAFKKCTHRQLSDMFKKVATEEAQQNNP